MGSPCELRLYGPTRLDTERAAEAARQELDRLEAKYSRFQSTSLTSVLNASAGSDRGIEVDPETASLLDYAATAFRMSDGLFDITAGVLRRAWNFKSNKIPSAKELTKILPYVGWQQVHWERPMLFLPKPGMELDFGGFVKEYAADRVAAICREISIEHGLVDLGGDLCVIGPHPDGSPWRVGVRDPRNPERAIAHIAIDHGGVATSGDYERFMIVDGKRYGHILDPRSGMPVRGLRSATVLADQCLIAGTASTISMLKGTAGAEWLAEFGLPHLRIDDRGRIAGHLATPSSAESDFHNGSVGGRQLIDGRHQ